MKARIPRGRKGNFELHLALWGDVPIDAERRNADAVKRAGLALHNQRQRLSRLPAQEGRREIIVVAGAAFIIGAQCLLPIAPASRNSRQCITCRGKPADPPVEQTTKFYLAINLKTRQGARIDDPPSPCWQHDVGPVEGLGMIDGREMTMNVRSGMSWAHRWLERASPTSTNLSRPEVAAYTAPSLAFSESSGPAFRCFPAPIRVFTWSSSSARAGTV